MFQFIIQMGVIIYIIFVIYNILNLQKYNYNGFILFYNGDIKAIPDELKNLNPLHITIHNTFCLEDIIKQNNNYIINDNDTFIPLNNIKNLDHLFIYKNRDLINNLSIEKNIHINKDFFQNPEILFIPNKTMTIYRNVKTKVHRAYHNYNIIGILDGETTFYLFNPKHKDEILDKENHHIKKWGHKKIMQKGDILFIPTNWYYFQETNNDVYQYHIDYDNIFTFIPHFFKSSFP
jgi:hypothetical protein